MTRMYDTSDPFDTPRPRAVRPGEYPVWDEALALVDRDLAALLPDRGPLRLMALPPWPEELSDDEHAPEHVYVALPDGRWHGDALYPPSAATPAGAHAAVAVAAQGTVVACLWQGWPGCAEHRLGMHPAEEDGRPVWRCAGGRDAGDPAHVDAAIGELEAPNRPRRLRRKQRGQNKRH